MTSPAPTIDLPRGFEDLRGRVFQQRYAVSEVLSFGRCHVVYGATDRKGAGQVLLRVMRPSVLHDRATVKRFEQRVQAARRASSLRARPSIDAGVAKDGKLFLVCKRPPGRSLGEYVRGHADGRLPWPVVKPLLQGFVEVLRAAHDRRIVHGGMTPDSFWVEEPEGSGPVAYLVDLGANPEVRLEGEAAAEVSRTTMLVADMEFTAPETIAASIYDERTDVYLLGLIAWFMLVGRPPFQGKNHFQVAGQQVQQAVPPMRGMGVGIPEEVEGLIGRMLAKRAEARPQTMGKVGAELMLVADVATESKRGVESAFARVEPSVIADPPLARSVMPHAAVVVAPVSIAAMRDAVVLGDTMRPSAVMPAESASDAPNADADTVIFRLSTSSSAISLPVLEATEVLHSVPVPGPREVLRSSVPEGTELLEAYRPAPSTERIERTQHVDSAQSSQFGATAVVSRSELATWASAPLVSHVPLPTATWPLQPMISAASVPVPSTERDSKHLAPHGIVPRRPRPTATSPLVWLGVVFGAILLIIVGTWLVR